MFQRRDSDLHVEVEVALTDAILGGEVKVGGQLDTRRSESRDRRVEGAPVAKVPAPIEAPHPIAAEAEVQPPSAKCPPEAEAAFQDVSRYRYFNTNNVWLHLPALAELLTAHHGFLPLPTIVNRKTPQALAMGKQNIPHYL